MVFFVATILLCLFILFYVIRLNIGQGIPLREWEWLDWMRIGTAIYWVFVSIHILYLYSISIADQCFEIQKTAIYPGVVLTLALVASHTIRKEKRINGNGNGKH